MMRLAPAALLAATLLASACSSGATWFDFHLPDGKTLVIAFETRVARQGPGGASAVDSSRLVSRLQVRRGGVIGRDPIQLAVRVDRVVVDRGAGGRWDSAAAEEPPGALAVDAAMVGLSYDVFLPPDLEAVVSNLRWAELPRYSADAEALRQSMTPRLIAADLAGSFRSLPRGSRKRGSSWRASSAVAAALTGATREVSVWWRYRSLEGGVATLTAEIEKPPVPDVDISRHTGTLRYDVAHHRPLEQTTSLVASVDIGGEPHTIETTQIATYALE